MYEEDLQIIQWVLSKVSGEIDLGNTENHRLKYAYASMYNFLQCVNESYYCQEHAASLNSSSVKVTPIMVNKPVSTVQVNATKVVNTAPRTLVTPVTAATAVTASKAIKFCAQCKTKPSKFECGGCSKIWYCSRETK